ncbi:AraC family transcriptional regulator [Halomonas sp. McH1-25]|uniref:AraC family transcriptional regulator n=1 Tax=unclassified Halomonas TaxID=2609666 RepID=UPI001EF5883D|nr:MULTISPECIES: AraC family transcriptional regulator [unclassified Halomonas]MCG7600356.1 AraC family transcriptional regulator [Halomonas sp. McH1-25]MCP1344233.1 AraC family transcriptional regulator [Halomonas sp. FL8]MCP1361482.1 AraC family transcriptional regulator [Halomonas sp. BBD45]MCP1364985.1 AraC family transcriptional regulator [Halomonas sp. BBD48]
MLASSPPMIDQQRLRDMASQLVAHHELHAPNWDQRAPLLEGSMRMIQPQPGMYVRLADVRDRYDLISEAELPPGIRLALVLSGQARVRFGHHQLTLGPANREGPAIQAMLLSLREKTDFQRIGRAHGHERTLTITLTPDWLHRHQASHAAERSLWQALGQHLGLATWTPSAAVLELAQRLFSAPQTGAVSELSERLTVEGCALALIGEGLSATRFPPSSHNEPPRLGKDRRLLRLREMIDSGEAHHLPQEILAARLNMSYSSLQRQFRARFGVSLGRYLRERRLQASREALSNEGISVEAAAALAGYTSAANFATAFKRQFGINPSTCRQP